MLFHLKTIICTFPTDALKVFQDQYLIKNKKHKWNENLNGKWKIVRCTSLFSIDFVPETPPVPTEKNRKLKSSEQKL